MFYCTTFNPQTNDCFLVCFRSDDNIDGVVLVPEKDSDIVALVQMKGTEIIWHKKGLDGHYYHFNECLMKEDMERFRDFYFENGTDGWTFDVDFPCVMNDSEVTYTWQTPLD